MMDLQQEADSIPTPELSVVVPTYQGAPNLRELTTRLDSVLDRQGMPYEIIFVNDASPDDTWGVLQDIHAEFEGVRVLDLLSNHGQHRATICGLAHARGRLVATMDDDLQHPPEELPKLIEALEVDPQLDAVLGAWERDHGIGRRLGSLVHAYVDRLVNDTPRGLRYTAFRLMRRPVVDAMIQHETRLPVVGPMLTQVTHRVRNVPVEHHDRGAGESTFRFMHGVRAVLTNLIQSSTLPLRLLTLFGMATSVLAFVLASIYVGRWVAGTDTPPGWLSTFLAVLFFSGAILFGIGLLGQYVHVIVREVKQPPRWKIRRELGANAGPSSIAREQVRAVGEDGRFGTSSS